MIRTQKSEIYKGAGSGCACMANTKKNSIKNRKNSAAKKQHSSDEQQFRQRS